MRLSSAIAVVRLAPKGSEMLHRALLRLAVALLVVAGAMGCGNRCESSTRYHPNIDLDAGPICQRSDAGIDGVCQGNRRILCPAGCACYSLRTLDACGAELYHGTAACFCGPNPTTSVCDVPNCGGIHCAGGCADADAGLCNLGV